MPATLEGQLVVAISSRALFDFEEENRLFEAGDDQAYMQLQLQRLDLPAPPGVAFSLVRKLLAFNDGAPRVEVVMLSRNDPVSGLRVFRSAQHYGLPVQRGVFTRGQPPGATCGRCAPTCSCRPTRPTCAPRWPPACRRRACTRIRRARPTRTRTRCASPSTATRCCSATRPSACSSATGSMPSMPTRRAHAVAAAGGRPLQAAAAGAAAAAARAGARACASAPRWSPHAARRRTSARCAR